MPGIGQAFGWAGLAPQTVSTPGLAWTQVNQAPQTYADYLQAIQQAQQNALGANVGQQGLVGQLQGQVAGTGPSLAQNTLQNALNQSNQLAAGAQASLRGPNVGLGQRLIAQNQAGNNMQAAQQAATLRLQEMLGSEGLLGQTLAQQQAGNTSIFGAANNANAAQNQQRIANTYDQSQQNIQQAIANQNATLQTQGLNAGIQGKQGDVAGNVLGKLGGALTQAGASGAPAPLNDVAANGGIGLVGAAHGALIPGRAPVPGDSPKNDIVPAELSPGEIVLPRHVTMAKDAPEAAKRFVEQMQAREAAKTSGGGAGPLVASIRELKAHHEKAQALHEAARAKLKEIETAVRKTPPAERNVEKHFDDGEVGDQQSVDENFTPAPDAPPVPAVTPDRAAEQAAQDAEMARVASGEATRETVAATSAAHPLAEVASAGRELGFGASPAEVARVTDMEAAQQSLPPPETSGGFTAAPAQSTPPATRTAAEQRAALPPEGPPPSHAGASVSVSHRGPGRAPAQPDTTLPSAVLDNPGQARIDREAQQNIEAQAANEAKRLAAESKLREELVAGTQVIDADNAAWLKHRQETADRMFADAMATKEDPGRFWANRSEGQRVEATIGMILGAFGSGATNYGVDVLNKAIDRDIDSQKADRGNKFNLFNTYLRETGNEMQARELTRAHLESVTAGRIAAQAAQSNSQNASLLGQQGVLDYQQKVAQRLQQVATQRRAEAQQNLTNRLTAQKYQAEEAKDYASSYALRANADRERKGQQPAFVRDPEGNWIPLVRPGAEQSTADTFGAIEKLRALVKEGNELGTTFPGSAADARADAIKNDLLSNLAALQKNSRNAKVIDALEREIPNFGGIAAWKREAKSKELEAKINDIEEATKNENTAVPFADLTKRSR